LSKTLSNPERAAFAVELMMAAMASANGPDLLDRYLFHALEKVIRNPRAAICEAFPFPVSSVLKPPPPFRWQPS
jgi:hypothetical protein